MRYTRTRMLPPRRSYLSRYLVAFGVTVLALLLRLAIEHWFTDPSAFLFFTPAIMISAWYGGMGPGLFAVILGGTCANFFLLAPHRSFSVAGEDLSSILLFVLVGLQISWFGGQMHHALSRAKVDAQAARRSERLYRTLSSNFPDGFVCLFDRDVCWTLVEGAGLARAGLSRATMEGRKAADTLPQPGAAQVEAMCAAVTAGGSVAGEVQLGEQVYFCHALPLKPDPDAQHVGMIILEDITDRVRARQALQSAHDLLEARVAERTSELHFQTTLLESQNQASAEGILAVRNDGQVIFANRRFQQMWGLGAPDGADGGHLLLDADARRQMRRQLASQEQDPLGVDKAPTTINEPAGAEELILQDGRSVERYSAPIRDAANTRYGRVWFFRETTERKRLQREILDAGERERQRIGQDLHDDLCQQLTGIACLGRALQQQLEKRDHPLPDEAQAAHEIVQMVQDATARAQDLARGLQPVNLQRHGLVVALQELAASVQRIYRVPCRFHGDLPVTIDEAVGIQLYRISQEAVSNAMRHGKPNGVLIDLVVVGGRLILTIEDDGRGIPQPLPQHGLGLHTMSYRARMIGGSLTVEAGRPTGTTVTCLVPLQVPEEGNASVQREGANELVRQEP